MTRIITFYNNKGGVSKTTTLFNLAAFLSQQGKRALIADCDPQCNVTELFFASSEIVDDPSRDLPGTSIFEALLPGLSSGIVRIDPAEVVLVKSSLYENLHILRGDLEFSRAEPRLARAWDMAITEDVYEKKAYASLYRLLHSLGEEGSFDYVLCDVGPSTGAITRMTVLACDGFFLPLSPDRFSFQAVSVLVEVLKGWIRKHEEISKTFEPFRLEPFPGRPQFLGAIMQGYKARRAKAGWQEQIEGIMKATFLSEDGIPQSRKLDPQSPVVASIGNVGPLAPISLLLGRAIFDVRREDMKRTADDGTFSRCGDDVWQVLKERREMYRREIEKIAGALP